MTDFIVTPEGTVVQFGNGERVFLCDLEELIESHRQLTEQYARTEQKMFEYLHKLEAEQGRLDE
jgi:hypothetical protein